MSEVHSSSIPSGWKSRLHQVGRGRWRSDRGVVVTLKRRGLTPTIPRLAMRAATVLWLTCSPASCRSRVIRGAP